MRDSIIGNAITGFLAFVIVLVLYALTAGTFKDFGEQMLFSLINGGLLGIIVGKTKPHVLIAVIFSIIICMGTSLVKILLIDALKDLHNIALHVILSYYVPPGIIVGGIVGYHHQMSKSFFGTDSE